MSRYLIMTSLVIMLAACGTSPKTHFYVLDQARPSAALPARNAHGLRIGVWKARLPEFLDRSEIVTRRGPHTIELADFHKWAGRLDDNIARLVAHELGNRLHTGRVAVSPWPAYDKNDYQVKIVIDRFDGELGGDMVLSGAWRLLNGTGNRELAWQSFSLTSRADGPGYSDMIAALSTLTVRLADDIAAAIAARQPPPGPR